MKREWLVKTLALCVVVLFICVSFQPILAKDTISPMKKSDTKELLETIKDLANNKEIQDIIQKSEIKGSPIRFQQLLVKFQKEIIGVIEKNDVLNERLKKFSDLPCDCEKNSNLLWYPKIICFILLVLAFMSAMAEVLKGGSGKLWRIIAPIYIILNCPLDLNLSKKIN